MSLFFKLVTITLIGLLNNSVFSSIFKIIFRNKKLLSVHSLYFLILDKFLSWTELDPLSWASVRKFVKEKKTLSKWLGRINGSKEENSCYKNNVEQWIELQLNNIASSPKEFRRGPLGGNGRGTGERVSVNAIGSCGETIISSSSFFTILCRTEAQQSKKNKSTVVFSSVR